MPKLPKYSHEYRKILKWFIGLLFNGGKILSAHLTGIVNPPPLLKSDTVKTLEMKQYCWSPTLTLLLRFVKKKLNHNP